MITAADLVISPSHSHKSDESIDGYTNL